MKTGYQVYEAILSIWLFLSVFSNVCFVIVVLKNRHLRNTTNWLICNVGISDILLAAFAIPQELHDISHAMDYFESDFLCKTVKALPIFCITSSIFSMTVLSTERYSNIVRNKAIFTNKCGMAGAVVVIWLVSFAMSIPTGMAFGIAYVRREDRSTGNLTLQRACYQVASQTFAVVNVFMVLTVSIVIPQVIVYANYIRIGYFIWIRRKFQSSEQDRAVPSVSKSKVKVIKMLVWATVLFTVAWVPFFTLQAIEVLTSANSSISVAEPMYLTQIVLSTFGASYNVVIYLTFVKSYRKDFRNLFCCTTSARVEPTDSERANTTQNRY